MGRTGKGRGTEKEETGKEREWGRKSERESESERERERERAGGRTAKEKRVKPRQNRLVVARNAKKNSSGNYETNRKGEKEIERERESESERERERKRERETTMKAVPFVSAPQDPDFGTS